MEKKFEHGPIQKQFDLEKAKAGAKVVTRDGREARYLGQIKNPDYPLVFIHTEGGRAEFATLFTVQGKVSRSKFDNDLDLFMAPIETVWHYAILQNSDKDIFTTDFLSSREEIDTQIEEVFTTFEGYKVLDRLTYTTKE